MNEILKHQISRHDDIFFHSFQGQNRKAFPKRFTVSTEKLYISSFSGSYSILFINSLQVKTSVVNNVLQTGSRSRPDLSWAFQTKVWTPEPSAKT